jgi:uncharacterized protein YecT (DUF1311 family)
VRRWLVLLLAVIACGCASTLEPKPTPVWRRDTHNLAADRAAVRTCLTEKLRGCAEIIQDACIDPDSIPAQSRQCNWRAIAAWEDEMEVTLAALRANLGGRDLRNLEASQRAWDASMMRDVGAAMDMLEGGSLAGPVGADVRAHATAQRVEFLEMLRLNDGE